MHMKSQRQASEAAVGRQKGGTAARASGGPGNAAQLEAIATQLPGALAPVGDLDYYARRHDDFADRYSGTDLAPPDYYLGYGDKYIRRFSSEVGPLLSDSGRVWLVDVRQGLQVAMEDERERDPTAFDGLERDGSAFRTFAFDTHPECYWEAGLGELPFADLITIGRTAQTVQ